jgi:hypothetical protein
MLTFHKAIKNFGMMSGVLVAVFALAGVLHAQTWVELTPDTSVYGSPPETWGERTAHYDAANNRLIVFVAGRIFYGGPGNQVWILINANGLGGTPAWIKLQPSGAPPDSNGLESVVYDAVHNRLIVYGGCTAHCSPALDGVYVLTNANGLGGDPAWSWRPVNNPQRRVSHSSVYDPLTNRMISFAGHFAFFNCDQNDTRILSNANGLESGNSNWTTLSTSSEMPAIRCEHTAVYDEATNRMTVFAGTHLISSTPGNYDQDDYNDVWVLSEANGAGGTPAWTQLLPLGGPPALRSRHTAVYDPANNRMIIYGGVTWSDEGQNDTALEDLWELSHANGLDGEPRWTELEASGGGPGPLGYHAAAFDAGHQRMILFGGRNDAVDPPISNSVWVLILAQTVAIDIKPDSFPNSINLTEQGVLPVAILGSEAFDVMTVNPETINIGGVSLALRGSPKAPKLAYSYDDVNGDGFTDIMAFFDVPMLVAQQILTETTVALEVSGSLCNGTTIKGTDSVEIVHFR